MTTGEEATGQSWETAVEAVRKAVVAASMAATRSVSVNWTTLTGDARMPLDSARVVRFEMLAFFLHAMDRFLQDAGGATAKAALQQEGIAQGAIQKVFNTPLEGSGIENQTDDDWQPWMAEDMLMLVQAADKDYGRCKELAPDSGLAPFQNDSVAGRLGSRICRQVGYEEHPPLRLFIWRSALEALGTSRLKSRVEEACRALKR